MMAGIPVEFVLFALTLMAVAVIDRFALPAALAGLAAIVAWKLAVPGFSGEPGLAGLAAHISHEWGLLANLFLLLVAFALLARHVEQSGLPDAIPALLPARWSGGAVLLVLVFALSAVLDNIAAALIGGTIARHVFGGRVHPGYVAGIVASANAGGSGSVIGDTTTTMMWISGVSPIAVAPAYVAAVVALLVCAIPASLQQHRLSPVATPAATIMPVDRVRLAVVAMIIATAAGVNVAANLWAPGTTFPVLGCAVAMAILATSAVRRPDWSVVPEAARGAVFLLALVLAASLMPVERLPAAGVPSTLGLGVLSAAFDNIPLTALALKQGGYDWALLAYAVGFGGSMLWFGSSAGVAICGLYPEARSVGVWIKAGWHVPLAYAAGAATYLALRGWHPG